MKSYGDGWYCWHRNWNERIQNTRIPEELEIVYKSDHAHEPIRIVLCKHGCDDYELGEDEYYLDDIEDDLDWRHRINETDDESEEEEEEESVEEDDEGEDEDEEMNEAD